MFPRPATSTLFPYTTLLPAHRGKRLCPAPACHARGPDGCALGFGPRTANWPPGSRCPQTVPVPRTFPTTATHARTSPASPDRFAGPPSLAHSWPGGAPAPRAGSKIECCWQSRSAAPIAPTAPTPRPGPATRSTKPPHRRAGRPVPAHDGPSPNSRYFPPPPAAPSNDTDPNKRPTPVVPRCPPSLTLCSAVLSPLTPLPRPAAPASAPTHPLPAEPDACSPAEPAD